MGACVSRERPFERAQSLTPSHPSRPFITLLAGRLGHRCGALRHAAAPVRIFFFATTPSPPARARALNLTHATRPSPPYAPPHRGFLNATSPSPSGLPFLQLTPCRYNSISFQPAPALPFGGVALWDPATAPSTGCPAGSAPLGVGAGCLLAVSNASGLAATSAPPLAPGKDVPHAHGFSASMHLDEVKFAGICGCCDNDAAAAGDHGATGLSSEASLGLPYASILACNTTAGAGRAAAPAGMVLLTVDPAGCPAGWAPLAAPLAGRVVVGTPPFGVPARAFGGAPFPAGGAPAYPDHEHAFVLDFDTTAAGIELVSGSGCGGYGGNAHVHTVGATTGGAPAPLEQLPLASVLGCVKAQ